MPVPRPGLAVWAVAAEGLGRAGWLAQVNMPNSSDSRANPATPARARRDVERGTDGLLG